MDECHNVESEITKFIEVEITDRFCKKHLGINLSSYDEPEKLFKWVQDKYKPALNRMIEQVKQSLSMYNDGNTIAHDDIFKNIVKQNDMLDKHICKINRFLERFDPNSWIVNRDKRQDHRGTRVSLQFKPIDAVSWSEPYLFKFGEKRLLMSATILDKKAFCRSVGLDESKTGYITLPSTFPVENRPIHYMPVGKMSMKEMDSTLPKLAAAVREILKGHSNEKGIIHCTNFRVANYLRDVLNDPRILTHTSENRDATLKQHQDSKQPTVLCSPSMMEGVDLIDDLSRFQIIAKLPYPSLNDRALKKRIARDPWYYDYLTVRSFVQSLGRSVRHEKDHCVTYVLDECFTAFRGKCRETIPSYIKEAII
jgi:Rad3-related DNA helicase